MKPYDTTPAETSTAEEPALAYAYTHEQMPAGAITFYPQSLAQQSVILDFAKKEHLEIEFDNEPFELTQEDQKMLDQCLAEIEKGEVTWITQEEMDRKHKKQLAPEYV